MPARDPEERIRIARDAADASWARTHNWQERTASARAKSPVTFEGQLHRVRAEFPDMPAAQQRAMAEKRWRKQQQTNARKAAAAKRAKREAREAAAKAAADKTGSGQKPAA